MADDTLTSIRPLLSSEQTGKLLNMTGRNVRLLVARGMLQAVKLPGSKALRFRPETIERIVRENETAA